MKKYRIEEGHEGVVEMKPVGYADTLREARSRAWQRALEIRSDYTTTRPVWCGAANWNDPGRTVGGYDISFRGVHDFGAACVCVVLQDHGA